MLSDMSWTWLIEHWQALGNSHDCSWSVGQVAWANRLYSLRKARAEALSAEITLEQARQDSNQAARAGTMNVGAPRVASKRIVGKSMWS